MQFLRSRFSFSGCAPRSEYWLSAAMSFALPIISFLLLTAMLFAVSRQLHGDRYTQVVDSIEGLEEQLSQEQKRVLGERMGIDAPLVLQYWRWTSDIFFEGNFSEWMTTGKPVVLLGVPEELDYNHNLNAQNTSLIAQYILIGVWLLSVLLTLVFWCIVVVRRLHYVRASEWNLVWFFIPGLNLLAIIILGLQNDDKYR